MKIADIGLVQEKSLIMLECVLFVHGEHTCEQGAIEETGSKAYP